MGYLILGMLILFLSIPFYFISIFFGVVLSLLSISLLFIETGVQIDIENKGIRSFKKLFFVTKGVWYALNGVESCIIVYNRDAAIMSSRGSSNLVRTETFDLTLLHKTGRKKVIHEFTDHKLSIQTAKILSEKFGLEINDQFSEIQKEIARRMRRR